MKQFKYQTGEEIKRGDHIAYSGGSGRVEFLVTEKVGDPATDWYLQQYPTGGLMIVADGFGEVFLTEEDIDEDLVLLSRGS